MDWFQTIATSGITAAVTVFLIYVLKLFSEHKLAKALVTHESRIKPLGERRGEVIEELWKQAVNYCQAVQEYTSLGQLAHAGSHDSEQRKEQARRAGIALLDHYNNHRVYFDTSMDRLILGRVKDLAGRVIDFEFRVIEGPQESKDLAKQKADAWLEINKQVNDVAEELLRKLREELQGLLGI